MDSPSKNSGHKLMMLVAMVAALAVLVLFWWAAWEFSAWAFSNRSAEAIGGWWKSLTEAAK